MTLNSYTFTHLLAFDLPIVARIHKHFRTPGFHTPRRLQTPPNHNIQILSLRLALWQVSRNADNVHRSLEYCADYCCAVGDEFGVVGEVIFLEWRVGVEAAVVESGYAFH